MAHTEYGSNPEDTAIVTVRMSAAFNTQLLQACEQRGWVAQFSHYESYLSRERRAAVGSLRGASACVVFVNFDFDPAQAVETVEYFAGALSSQLTVVAVAQHLEPAIMLAAMRAGCNEFLSLDQSKPALFDVLENLERRTERAPRANLNEASVYSFFGVKGGVGTTSIAVHLAYYLRHISKKRVLLIDHQEELGEVCLYLGLDGTRAQFSECVRSVGRLDSELVRGFVVKHASGVEVLSSPDRCHESRKMDPEAIGRTLEFLRTEYDYILIDCADAAARDHETILEASTKVFLVATPDVSALRNLSRLMETLTPMDCCREKLQVVMNRVNAPEALSADQIQKAMHFLPAVQLASVPADMAQACNMGKPLAPEYKSPLVQQLMKWAGTLTGVSVKLAAPKKDKSFLSMFHQPRQTSAERG